MGAQALFSGLLPALGGLGFQQASQSFGGIIADDQPDLDGMLLPSALEYEDAQRDSNGRHDRGYTSNVFALIDQVETAQKGCHSEGEGEYWSQDCRDADRAVIAPSIHPVFFGHLDDAFRKPRHNRIKLSQFFGLWKRSDPKFVALRHEGV